MDRRDMMHSTWQSFIFKNDQEIEDNIAHNYRENGITPVFPRIQHTWGENFPFPDLGYECNAFQVRKIKPHVLLGLSGVGGVFNEEVLKAMKESDSTKPAIFAMSNPTKNAECTAEEAFKHAGENIIFASGSPFEHVHLGNGRIGYVNQANNMYLFPGIGLGALMSGARFISDGMLQAAAECLASYMTDEDIRKGILYPSINCIRNITAEVGAAVLRAAVAEELAEGHGDVGPRELLHMSKEETVAYVTRHMWYPIYSPLVHEK